MGGGGGWLAELEYLGHKVGKGTALRTFRKPCRKMELKS